MEIAKISGINPTTRARDPSSRIRSTRFWFITCELVAGEPKVFQPMQRSQLLGNASCTKDTAGAITTGFIFQYTDLRRSCPAHDIVGGTAAPELGGYFCFYSSIALL